MQMKIAVESDGRNQYLTVTGTAALQLQRATLITPARRHNRAQLDIRQCRQLRELTLVDADNKRFGKDDNAQTSPPLGLSLF